MDKRSAEEIASELELQRDLLAVGVQPVVGGAQARLQLRLLEGAGLERARQQPLRALQRLRRHDDEAEQRDHALEPEPQAHDDREVRHVDRGLDDEAEGVGQLVLSITIKVPIN